MVCDGVLEWLFGAIGMEMSGELRERRRKKKITRFR
jgi:hypothetical protein